MTASKVGADIDAWCTRCKMNLGHTILAERRAARPSVTSWEALLAGKDLARARRYSARDKYTPEEVIQHPLFGIGLVQEVRGDKIQVAFKADVKTLVHGK